MKHVHIYDLRSNQLIAAYVQSANFAKWCSMRGYLPHHKTGFRWYVIAA